MMVKLVDVLGRKKIERISDWLDLDAYVEANTNKINELIDADNIRSGAVMVVQESHECEGLKEQGLDIAFSELYGRWELHSNSDSNFPYTLVGAVIRCPCCDWEPGGQDDDWQNV